MSNIEARFHQEMLDGYQTLAKLGYRANYYLQMLQEHGGVGAAQRLLQSEEFASGLTRLWEMKRLDLSLRHWYSGLSMLCSSPTKSEPAPASDWPSSTMSRNGIARSERSTP